MRTVFNLACAFAGLTLALTLWSAPALSDQLQMVPPPASPSGSPPGSPSGSQSAANRPARGMTMEKVEAKYGAPARKVAAVGNPPIERWEYSGFTVYFEYRKVIHSVAELAR